jgi:surfeit locus 1 family protein
MWKHFFSLRWILTTLLVIVGVGVLIRLGIWQLDRLEWRRAFNARVISQINAEPLDLNLNQPADALYDMEYRQVTVAGTYDFNQEVLLRNQTWDNQMGFHVLTPLKITGSDWYVLVDRGWIPYEDAGNLSTFQESGSVSIQGILRRAQEKPDFGGVPDPTLAPNQSRLDTWNVVNLPRITTQSGLKMLPVYIIARPAAAQTGLPYRSLPAVEISEGSHLSYAIQWFTFAAILGVGYPFFVRRQLKKSETSTEAVQTSAMVILDLKEKEEKV